MDRNKKDISGILVTLTVTVVGYYVVGNPVGLVLGSLSGVGIILTGMLLNRSLVPHLVSVVGTTQRYTNHSKTKSGECRECGDEFEYGVQVEMVEETASRLGTSSEVTDTRVYCPDCRPSVDVDLDLQEMNRKEKIAQLECLPKFVIRNRMEPYPGSYSRRDRAIYYPYEADKHLGMKSKQVLPFSSDLDDVNVVREVCSMIYQDEPIMLVFRNKNKIDIAIWDDELEWIGDIEPEEFEVEWGYDFDPDDYRVCLPSKATGLEFGNIYRAGEVIASKEDKITNRWDTSPGKTPGFYPATCVCCGNDGYSSKVGITSSIYTHRVEIDGEEQILLEHERCNKIMGRLNENLVSY